MKLLFLQLQRLYAERDLELGMDGARIPDGKWMLDVISTLDPANRIFAKDYHPKVHEDDDVRVDNSDGFFSGLPEQAAAP